LSEAKIIKKILKVSLFLEFDYASMNKVMRVIKKHSLQIKSQTLEMQCEIALSIPRSDLSKIKNLFLSLQHVIVKE
jgi:putative IMPACT (imprinted ancient) family translation regulator